MAVRVYKISEYDHLAERRQFNAICALLEDHYASADSHCILIGNYNIEGVELDALLITQGGFRVLEFKNWGGKIVARENGTWTSDNMIVEGGAAQKSPYEQIRLNKSRTSKGLANLLDISPNNISAAIIFWQDCTFDTSQLSDSVKKWLTVCDNRNLHQILHGLDRNFFTSEFIQVVPHTLRIEEFASDSKNHDEHLHNTTHEADASENYYRDLESALSLLPDYRKAYSVFGNVFQRVINDKIRSTRLNFSGSFSKTDYLLKEHSADRRMVSNTNATRVRLRKKNELTDEYLQKCFLTDLQNLCDFISFLYDIPVPQSLIAHYPEKRVSRVVKSAVAEYMRVIVESWDDDFIYCKSEDEMEGDVMKVAMAFSDDFSVFEGFDWHYMKQILRKDAQLNLIRPREDNEVVYPELIIFEPDFLVNISTIAGCFTNYADSPFVNLSKKLNEAVPTEATVLGNLAGQFLDETIHQPTNPRSYTQSALDFYKGNALDLLVIDQSPRFHQNAQSQKHNISKAINETLPAELRRFNSKEGIVEPSFFSEMLGLQGRMDYLQLDYKVLFEQKSGKGEFIPYDKFVKPIYKKEHYVQLLLYMLLLRYNFREVYEKNNRELHSFLLYSKYDNSLVPLGFAPELVFEALKLRNRLAWTEMLYSKPDGYRILETMTPDSLNIKNTSDLLWTKYQKPEIEKFLATIQNASELEKAYYFRFLTFISNEHLQSKLGNKSKENSGFASTWHDSLDEKLIAGNIYDKLSVVSPSDDTEGKIERVVMKFSESVNNDMSNFRAGDIVVLYPYVPGTEPDIRKTMVFRCTIEDIQTDKITLFLRNAQSDNRVFVKESGKLWAIEHDFMESSYSSLYRGMHAFLSAPKKRRDLLLLQREPEVDDTVSLKGEYGCFNELMLRVKRAKDLFLIIGPPGTGKTSFGMLNTVKEELLEPNSNILLLSYTNRAVDEICGKLAEESIDFLRIGNDLSCAEEYRCHLLKSKVENSGNISEIERLIKDTRVFVGTTTSFNAHMSFFKVKQFSLVVIDEASQILEPHLIGIFSTHDDGGKPAVGKIVMIGDHKQLPAVVKQEPEVSKVQDPLLQDILLKDCRLSLFERLLKKYAGNDKVTYMLRRQGRMHHDIALFPNNTFYHNQLVEVPLPHQNVKLPLVGKGTNGIDHLLQTRRLVFLAADAPKSANSDKVNQNEADMIAATIVRIYELNKDDFDVTRTVGVIVPYRNQIATVRNTLDNYGIKCLHDITIDTVERYQGSQRKYIVYGFTVQKFYQLNFLTATVFEDMDGTIIDRKLNVAMTRAEEHLIMVGNPDVLHNNHIFTKLIEFVRSRQGYFEIPRHKYVAGDFRIPEFEPDEMVSDMTCSVFPTALFQK